MLANMPYKCTYNSHLLLLKFHVISKYNISIVFMASHVSEAMIIVGGTPESLELAMSIESGDLSCYSCDNY